MPTIQAGYMWLGLRFSQNGRIWTNKGTGSIPKEASVTYAMLNYFIYSESIVYVPILNLPLKVLVTTIDAPRHF